MSDPEINVLNLISVKVGRLEASNEATVRALTDMTASLQRLVDKLDRSDDIAREALEKVKSAQHQINDEKARLTKSNEHYDNEIRTINNHFAELDRERKADRRWRVGTLITLGSLTLGVISLTISILRG